MKLLRLVILLALVVGASYVSVRFYSENDAKVTIDLLAVQFSDVALWLALLAAFAAGAALVGILTLYQLARLGLLARSYRRLAAKRESEIHQLRNLPLGGEAPGAKALAEVEPGGAREAGGGG